MNESGTYLTGRGGKSGSGSSGCRLRFGAGIIFAFLLVSGIVVWWLSRPCLYIVSENHVFYDAPVAQNARFSTRFIHSVQKTPVLENFIVDVETVEIILDSTRYESFNAGLPFLQSDGVFIRKDGYFLIENMNRRFPSVVMRTGMGTKLTLFVDDREIRFYETIPDGSAVKFYIAPYYERFIREGRD